MRAFLMKIAALAFVAAIVPACGTHDKYFYVKLTNQGAVAVDATIEPVMGYGQGSGETNMSVGPRGWSQIRFLLDSMSSVRVRVYRTTDNGEIFDETWTRNEVDHLGRLIEITVTP